MTPASAAAALVLMQALFTCMIGDVPRARDSAEAAVAEASRHWDRRLYDVARESYARDLFPRVPRATFDRCAAAAMRVHFAPAAMAPPRCAVVKGTNPRRERCEAGTGEADSVLGCALRACHAGECVCADPAGA